MRPKHYLSCPTLDEWFDMFNPNQGDWMIDATIGDLKDALTENGILMVEATDKQDHERFLVVQNAIIYALRNLNSMRRDVEKAIENGEIFEQTSRKKKGDDDDDDDFDEA